MPSKLNLHSRRWFAGRKHSGADAAQKAAEDELKEWRIALRTQIKPSVSMSLCLNCDVASESCPCVDAMAHHCRAFCKISSDSFEHKLILRLPLVSSTFAKRHVLKTQHTPTKETKASAATGKDSPGIVKIKRLKAQDC